MTVLAVHRSWDLPLFVHVLGAMLVTASVVVAIAVLVLAWGAEADRRPMFTRIGFRTLLLAGIPSLIVMRVAAEWVLSESPYDSGDPTWIGLGFMTSDASVLLLIIATILTGIGQKRLRAGTGGSGLAKTGTVLVGIVFVLYIVAVWAMTAKPT